MLALFIRWWHRAKIAGKFIGRKHNDVSLWLTSKPLLKKSLYTLILILIFRIAASITTPGVDPSQAVSGASDSFIGILDLMGGGALRNFSIVALGISPYITSSIIMSLLQTEVFPPIYRLSQSGQRGRRKINVITRVLTLFFAYLQAVTIILQFPTGTVEVGYGGFWYLWVAIPIILIAGSLFTLFLGEQITANGVGNGTSLIIFSGIAVNLPTQFRSAAQAYLSTEVGETSFKGIVDFMLYCIGFLALIFLIGWFHKAERHIPIQQTGSGLTKDVNQMSRLPIKVNPAGVMPVIFAMTITVLPLTIVQFLDQHNEGRIWIENNLGLTDGWGLGLFVSIILLFSVVMGLVTFNPTKVTDQFKKNGTFIPGVKPGEQTETYLTNVVIRLSLFSAFYLASISAIEYIQQIAGIPSNISFGGTTMIILVSVAIETIEQMKARETTQKLGKNIIDAKGAGASEKEDDLGGLLW